MHSGAGVVDDSVEAVVVVGGVLHFTYGAVGFEERVLAVHDISVAALVLRLVVAGVSVRHGVRELVVGVRLCRKQELGYCTHS